nr:superoxide dismutase [candidate division Zixibacteria bacterium]
MKTHLLMVLLTAGILILLPPISRSHCQIPCGIYDDAMRYDMLEEHITTIEKSMNQINELSAASEINYNQLVRWITNKEDHCGKFMDIVWQYFMTQRIKPTAVDAGEEYNGYITQLTTMHEMLVTAMKCKQTTDTANTDRLKELVAKSKQLYFKDHGHEH